MSSLTNILNIGKSGLLTHQASISTVSQNTANATTPGYAKRDVRLTSLGPESGVGIESVRRRADAWMQQRVLLERSRLGSHKAQSDGLQALELSFGDSRTSVGSVFDRFFAAVGALSTAPTDRQLRESLLTEARSLTEVVSNTANHISRERSQADTMIPETIDRINTITAELTELNRSISAREAGGDEASEGRDRREILLDELAEHVDYTLLGNDKGEPIILIGGGHSLVDGQQRSVLRSEPDAAYGDLRRVDLVNASGLASDVTSRLRSGKLGGLLQLRDETLTGIAERLDSLAYDFATSVNAIHSAGYGEDGVGGRNFFQTPAGVAGAATNLSLETDLFENPEWVAASTTVVGAVGGNDNLLALGALADEKAASGNERTFAEEIAAITGTVGQVVREQKLSLERAQGQVTQLQAIHDAQTRVSIDEELIDITRFQRAYQASAKIIQTVEMMFETVLQL